MYNWNSSNPTLMNVTFSSNTAGYSGGGVMNAVYSNPTLTNSILWGNTAPLEPQIANYAGSNPSVSYSDIQGSYLSESWSKEGNIAADPLFVDALNNNLHLQIGSPAIDSGTNTNCPIADFDGVPRPLDGNNDGVATCDMGAFEYVRPPNQPPVADVGGPYSVEWGVSITLHGSGSTDPDNNLVTYEWDLNADSIYDVAGMTTTTSFTQIGDHVISLRVTDTEGLSDEDTTTVNVTDPTLPVITLTINGSLGNDSWYVSDVAVSWEIHDPESGISSSDGCDATILTADTAGITLTCSVTNGAGLSNSASATMKIDKTLPTIVAAATTVPNAAGWYKEDVTVHFTCDDMSSGIPAGTCPADQLLSVEGAAIASIAQTVADAASNVSAESNIVSVGIDKTPPLISWTGGVDDGDNFYFGFVPPEPTCTAADDLSGMEGVCTVTGYASTIGTHTLSATARDHAGNVATETRTCTVLAWTLKGFYQPVDMNGVYNLVKGGSTVPFKFEIFAGSTELIDTTYIKSLTYSQTTCDANAIKVGSRSLFS